MTLRSSRRGFFMIFVVVLLAVSATLIAVGLRGFAGGGTNVRSELRRLQAEHIAVAATDAMKIKLSGLAAETNWTDESTWPTSDGAAHVIRRADFSAERQTWVAVVEVVYPITSTRPSKSIQKSEFARSAQGAMP